MFNLYDCRVQYPNHGYKYIRSFNDAESAFNYAVSEGIPDLFILIEKEI